MRRLPIKTVLLATVATIIFTSPASAQLTVSGEVADTPFPRFTQGPPSTAESFLEVPTSDLQPFNVNFGNEGDVALKFVWRAPAGQCFRVDAPAGYEEVMVSFEFALDAPGGSGGLPNVGTMGFRKPDGNVADSVNVKGRFSSDMSNDLTVKITAEFDPGKVTTFESFEVSFLIDAGYNTNFQNVNIDIFRVAGFAEGPSGITVADAGNWLSLVAAPQSRSEALAQRSKPSRKAKKFKKKSKKTKKKGNRKKARKLKKKSRKVKREAAAILIPTALPGFISVLPQSN